MGKTPDEYDRASTPDDRDITTDFLMTQASYVLMFRTIRRDGEVKLSQKDFEDYDNFAAAGDQGIEFDADEDDNVIFRHTNVDLGEPVN